MAVREKYIDGIFETVNPQYPIPGFSKYMITCDGILVDKEKQYVVQVQKSQHGYAYFKVIRDSDGKRIGTGRHRLLCLAFKPLPEGMKAEELMVNHINHVKGDDRLDNLEWVTAKENSQKAADFGVMRSRAPLSVRNAKTGEIRHYQTRAECAQALGLTTHQLMHRVLRGDRFVGPDYLQLRYRNDELPWYKPSVDELENCTKTWGTNKGLYVKDVLTGEVTHFDQIVDAGKYYGLSPACMTGRLNAIGQPVFPGYLQFKYDIDPTPWREVSDPQLELMNTMKNIRAVQKINAETGEVTVYMSARECAYANNLLPTTLDWRLKSRGTIVYPDNCRYGYYPEL